MSEHKPHISPEEEWLREGHVDCVSCPVCAFTFDACHEDQRGGYSCPLCAELRLQEQLEALQRDDSADYGYKARFEIVREQLVGMREQLETLQRENAGLKGINSAILRRARCDECSSEGHLCDRWPGHEGAHVSWQSVEWTKPVLSADSSPASRQDG